LDRPSDWTARLPELNGRLVTVREVVASDAATLFEFLSDPDVTEHLNQPPPSAAAFAGFIRWAQAQRAERKGVCFAIVPHGLTEAIGMVQVRALEPSFFTCEWGFAVGKPFWGTGVFLEAAALVAGFAFTTLGTHRIEARAAGENARGHAAIQKLGARAEGTLAKAFRKDGRLDKQLLWTLTRDDWRESSGAAPRVTSSEAAAQIAGAIAETKRIFSTLERQEPSAQAEAFPFFLTDSRSWGAAVRGQQPVPATPRRPRVLMIDDNQTQLDLYALVIEDVADVEKATRGEDGYRLARRDRPDLIVVDVLMPDVDGLALVNRIRSDAGMANIPIVVLTGDDASYARAQAEPLAFSAILMKPCPAELLLNVIKTATQG
jgi:ribosomal-protein-alanine N-acetyltransferase